MIVLIISNASIFHLHTMEPMLASFLSVQSRWPSCRNWIVTSSVACVIARMIPWSKGSTSDVRFFGRSFVCLTLCILRQLAGEKVTNKNTGIVYLFLKFIYLFIYLFIALPCFGYSLVISRVPVICYNRRNKVYIFQDTVIYISVLRFQFIMYYNYK